MMDQDDKCFCCGKAFRSLKRYPAQVVGESTVVWVGPDCYKRIIDSDEAGYQHPGGGPALCEYLHERDFRPAKRYE